MANVHVKRPIIGISMGDPFGNGPEITVSALSDASVYTRCRPLVVGDYTSLSYACRVAEKLGRTAPVLHRIESVEDAFLPLAQLMCWTSVLCRKTQFPIL